MNSTTITAFTDTAEAIALKNMTTAVEHVRQLEAQCERVFAELNKARALCEESGMVVDVKMSPGLSAAYSSYKQDRAREDARNDSIFDSAAEEAQYKRHG